MSTQTHFTYAPVPPWALDDEKVRKVVAYRIAITAIEPNVPTTLDELRTLEPRYVAFIRSGVSTPESQLHLEKITRFGGPIAYYTSLIYRRFRLGMDSPSLARYYGCKPTAIRQTINRLCRIARALFPNAEDHLPWHPSSKQRAIPTLRLRDRARTCSKPSAPTRGYDPRPHSRKFDWEKARELRQAGLSFTKIARRFGVSHVAVCRALRKMGNYNPRPRHKFDWEKAQDLRLAGLTLRAIAKQVGVSSPSVCRALRKMENCNAA